MTGILERARSVLSSYFPSWVPNEFALSQDKTACLCDKFLADKDFLTSLGFPVVTEKAEASGVKIVIEMATKKACMSIDKLTFQGDFAAEKASAKENKYDGMELEIKVAELYVEIATHNMVITAENSVFVLGKGSCMMQVNGLKMQILGSVFLQPVNAVLRRDSGEGSTLELNMEEVNVRADRNQLEVLAGLRDAMKMSFQISMHIKLVNVKLESESMLVFHTCSIIFDGTNFSLTAEAINVNLSGVVFVMSGVLFSRDKIVIEAFESRAKFLTIKSRQGEGLPFLMGERQRSKIKFSIGIDITVKHWALGFLHSIVNSDFYVKHLMHRLTDNRHETTVDFRPLRLVVELGEERYIDFDMRVIWTHNDRSSQFVITPCRVTTDKKRAFIEVTIIQVVFAVVQDSDKITLMIAMKKVAMTYDDMQCVCKFFEAIKPWMNLSEIQREKEDVQITCEPIVGYIGNATVDGLDLVPIFRFYVGVKNIEVFVKKDQDRNIQIQFKSWINFDLCRKAFSEHCWDYVIESVSASFSGKGSKHIWDVKLLFADVAVNWTETLVNDILLVMSGVQMNKAKRVKIHVRSRDVRDLLVSVDDRRNVSLGDVSRKEGVALSGKSFFVKTDKEQSLVFVKALAMPMLVNNMWISSKVEEDVHVVISSMYMFVNVLDIKVQLSMEGKKIKDETIIIESDGELDVSQAYLSKGGILLTTKDAKQRSDKLPLNKKGRGKPIIPYALPIGDTVADCIVQTQGGETDRMEFVLKSKYVMINDLPVAVSINFANGLSGSDNLSYKPGEKRQVLLAKSAEHAEIDIVFAECRFQQVSFQLRQGKSEREISDGTYTFLVCHEPGPDIVYFRIKTVRVIVNHTEMQFRVSTDRGSHVKLLENGATKHAQVYGGTAVFSTTDAQVSFGVAQSQMERIVSTEKRMMLLRLVGNTPDRYHAVNVRTESIGQYIITHLSDVLLVHNRTSHSITIDDGFGVIEPRESISLALRTAEGLYALRIAGYEVVKNVFFDIPCDIPLHFCDDKGGITIRLMTQPDADGRMVATFDDCFITNSPYLIVNDTDHVVYAQQHNDVMPFSIEPRMTQTFGFECPSTSQLVMITIEGVTFSVSFDKDIQSCFSMTINDRKIHFSVRSEGWRRLLALEYEKLEVCSVDRSKYVLRFINIDVTLIENRRPLYVCGLEGISLEPCGNGYKACLFHASVTDIGDRSVVLSSEPQSEQFFEMTATDNAHGSSVIGNIGSLAVRLNQQFCDVIADRQRAVTKLMSVISSFDIMRANRSFADLAVRMGGLILKAGKDGYVSPWLMKKVTLSYQISLQLPSIRLSSVSGPTNGVFCLYQHVLGDLLHTFQMRLAGESVQSRAVVCPSSLVGSALFGLTLPESSQTAALSQERIFTWPTTSDAPREIDMLPIQQELVTSRDDESKMKGSLKNEEPCPIFCRDHIKNVSKIWSHVLNSLKTKYRVHDIIYIASCWIDLRSCCIVITNENMYVLALDSEELIAMSAVGTIQSATTKPAPTGAPQAPAGQGSPGQGSPGQRAVGRTVPKKDATVTIISEKGRTSKNITLVMNARSAAIVASLIMQYYRKKE